MRERFFVLGTFRHHLQRVEYRIVGTFLILFGLLLFLEFLRQFRGDLRGVLLVEMLHQPFGNTGLAVIHGTLAEIDVEPVGEVFKQPDAFGVDAGGRQVDDFRDAVLAIGAGGFDVGEIHVRPYVNAEWIGDAMHHFAHAEASRTCAQIEHADAYDHTCLGCDAGFGNRLVPVTFDVLHVERNGMSMEFADGLRTVFSVLVMLMF